MPAGKQKQSPHVVHACVVNVSPHLRPQRHLWLLSCSLINNGGYTFKLGKEITSIRIFALLILCHAEFFGKRFIPRPQFHRCSLYGTCSCDAHWDPLNKEFCNTGQNIDQSCAQVCSGKGKKSLRLDRVLAHRLFPIKRARFILLGEFCGKMNRVTTDKWHEYHFTILGFKASPLGCVMSRSVLGSS